MRKYDAWGTRRMEREALATPLREHPLHQFRLGVRPLPHIVLHASVLGVNRAASPKPGSILSCEKSYFTHARSVCGTTTKHGKRFWFSGSSQTRVPNTFPNPNCFKLSLPSPPLPCRYITNGSFPVASGRNSRYGITQSLLCVRASYFFSSPSDSFLNSSIKAIRSGDIGDPGAIAGA